MSVDSDGRGQFACAGTLILILVVLEPFEEREDEMIRDNLI